MSSDNIAARNRANAQKSTGPRTAQGKATVSQNARRHGATSKPDPTSVAAWLRIILDDPDLQPAGFMKNDRRFARALALAEAEVSLCSARAALDLFESGEEPPYDAVRELQNWFKDNNSLNISMSGTVAGQRRTGASPVNRTRKIVDIDTAYADATLGGKRHLLRQRYVREARAHRKRAFAGWLQCLGQERILAGESA